MSYTDYNNFDQSYFEGGHEAGYSHYREDMLPFADYTQKIRDELEAAGQNVDQTDALIVGSAHGFTVQHLVNYHGIDAWGMDISQYAVDAAVMPSRIVQGDVLNQRDIKNVAQTKRGGKFNVIVVEAVLCTLTDAEAVTAAENVRAEAQDTVLWRVWSTDGSELNTDWYNAKTMDEWRSLCDPNDEDVWFSELEFQPKR